MKVLIPKKQAAASWKKARTVRLKKKAVLPAGGKRRRGRKWGKKRTGTRSYDRGYQAGYQEGLQQGAAQGFEDGFEYAYLESR